MRLDKLLWFLRVAKTRTRAQQWIGEGHIRVNGRRVERPHHSIAIGDVITVPVGERVIVLSVTTIPSRRGPASEAAACYRRLDGLDADGPDA